MTTETAYAVANAVIAVREAKTALRSFEERGNFREAREARRILSNAESTLDAAIAEAEREQPANA